MVMRLATALILPLLLAIAPGCGLFEWPTNQELYERQDFELLQLRFLGSDDDEGREAGRLLRLLHNDYPVRAWSRQRSAIKALYGPLYALQWERDHPMPRHADR